jgi:hypothetical protein
MANSTFYWVGATAASFNSFSWDIASNWRIMVQGGVGSTANPKATLVVANRCPIGGDSVNFGRPYGIANSYLPAPFNILSPCLFGGVTTAANKVWSGATAGSTVFERYGGAYTYVHPSYPFAQIGGLITHPMMAQWSTHLSAILGATTLAAWGWTGSSYFAADQEWSNIRWFGASAGISAANQPTDTLYYRGSWVNQAKSLTWTRIYGVTAATAGASGSVYDGSGNQVQIENAYMKNPWRFPQVAGATSPRAEGDNMTYTTGFSGGPYASPFWGTDVPPGDAYSSGYVAVSGFWNRVKSENIAPRHLVFHNYGKVNSITFKPQLSVYGTTTDGAYNLYAPTSQKRVFDIAVLYHGQDSSARVIDVDGIDQIHSYGIRVLGNVTQAGGFVCAQPAGASQGSSGGVALPNGSVRITPPARLGEQLDIDDLGTAVTFGVSMDRAVVYLGYRQGNSDTSTTTISSLYAEAGATTPVEYTILGNYFNTNSYMNWGKLSISEDINSLSGITISNLYLYGNSEFDMANAPNLQGRTTVEINAQSNSCIVKPSAGTSLKVGNIYAELLLAFAEIRK